MSYYSRAMTRIEMRCVTRVNKSRQTYEWGVSYIRMSCVALVQHVCMNESCGTWLIHVWHLVTDSCVTWLIHMCAMWYSSFICVTWRIYIWRDSSIWHDSCFIHMCDMTDAYVWHVSSICVTWLIHTSDMWCNSWLIPLTCVELG